MELSKLELKKFANHDLDQEDAGKHHQSLRYVPSQDFWDLIFIHNGLCEYKNADVNKIKHDTLEEIYGKHS